MRFTLRLSDYLEQYVINTNTLTDHCPICYDKILTFNKEIDIEHMVTCYKIQLLELQLQSHFEDHGEYPVLTESYIMELNDRIESEMSSYHTIYG